MNRTTKVEREAYWREYHRGWRHAFWVGWGTGLASALIGTFIAARIFS